MSMDQALTFARTNRERFLGDLIEMIRIPSVSTQTERAADIRRMAEWLITRLTRLGFQTRLLPTEGSPAVYGELPGGGSGAPILLLYGHYDVQPAEPLEEWSSPPFEPEVRGENLYGRGASDMKGPLSAYLAALESAIAAGPMPVSIKILFEGEEEVGSPHLAVADGTRARIAALRRRAERRYAAPAAGPAHHRLWAARAGILRATGGNGGARPAFRALRGSVAQRRTDPVRIGRRDARFRADG